MGNSNDVGPVAAGRSRVHSVSGSSIRLGSSPCACQVVPLTGVSGMGGRVMGAIMRRDGKAKGKKSPFFLYHLPT